VHAGKRIAPEHAWPIVLVHGLAVSHRYLMPTAALLARRPGRRARPARLRSQRRPALALDTARLADALGGWLHAAGTAPAVLLGNSYGCQVIVDLVARHPEVAAAAVLSGPTTDPHARTVTRQVLRWLRDAMHEDPLQAPILLRDVCLRQRKDATRVRGQSGQSVRRRQVGALQEGRERRQGPRGPRHVGQPSTAERVRRGVR
jgi:pimeloyl-ACP methyl ester carboxylesterase